MEHINKTEVTRVLAHIKSLTYIADVVIPLIRDGDLTLDEAIELNYSLFDNERDIQRFKLLFVES